MTSGGQFVVTTGILLMLMWSASSWDTMKMKVSTLMTLQQYKLPTSLLCGIPPTKILLVK